VTPFAAVFNNLVTFDPFKVHESIDTVIPDLAESWAWDETNTKLTFKLRQGVKWHDGASFTAKDVQCTWRMIIGKSDIQDFKRNPRKVWYTKLRDVSINGDYEATFELSEPQPALPVLLASAFSPVYPCHVPQAAMRTKPVGTGPFRLEGPAVSRRDHLSDDRQPRDTDAGVCDRRLRHHFSIRRQRSPDAGRQGAGAERDLRDHHHRYAIQPDGEPRTTAVRQCRAAQGDVAGD